MQNERRAGRGREDTHKLGPTTFQEMKKTEKGVGASTGKAASHDAAAAGSASRDDETCGGLSAYSDASWAQDKVVQQ